MTPPPPPGAPRGRIPHGLGIARKSWIFLLEEPRVLLLPAASLASSALLALIALPVFVVVARHHGARPVQLLLAAAFAAIFTTVSTFWNVAFLATVQARLRGADPSLRAGLARARFKLPQIVAWALVSASVGLLLRLLESIPGGGLVARIVE